GRRDPRTLRQSRGRWCWFPTAGLGHPLLASRLTKHWTASACGRRSLWRLRRSPTYMWLAACRLLNFCKGELRSHSALATSASRGGCVQLQPAGPLDPEARVVEADLFRAEKPYRRRGLRCRNLLRLARS